MLLDKFKALYNLPMRDAVFIIRNKIAPVRIPPVDRIATSGKLMRPARPWEFLTKYEAILANALGWQPLDFRGANVMEIGCGPLLGFAPLALYRGAAACTCVEPYFTPEALTDGRIVERYFRPMWNMLALIHGPGPDFEAFMEAVRAIDVQAAPLDRAEVRESAGPVDIVLSNSCLEHIVPLEPSLTRLRALCRDGARCIHLVNFGNHAGTRDPFKGLYSRKPDGDYLDKGFGDINLLRAKDVRDMLARAGFACDMTVCDQNDLFARGDVHPWWSERYSPEELGVRAALFSCPASASTSTTRRPE